MAIGEDYTYRQEIQSRGLAVPRDPSHLESRGTVKPLGHNTISARTSVREKLSSFSPSTYKGLQNFHRYWGKKPADLMSLLVSALSPREGCVLDPFVGYGSIAGVCRRLDRHFVGIDINPSAIRITQLLSEPPNHKQIENEFAKLAISCQGPIGQSYFIGKANCIASHYLWHQDQLKEIWSVEAGRKRVVYSPENKDLELISQFSGYQTKNIRPIKLFDNSRINAKEELQISDFFTRRALRNIDILLDAIRRIENIQIRNAFLLCLTSGLGQMSRMVFAISGRGKTSGKRTNKIEVGSWVIGYWRPRLHFELNVWNCFSRRVRRLVNACQKAEIPSLFSSTRSPSNLELVLGDCVSSMQLLPKNSVDLIVTDPPHGDRIPYLELSELWNSVLGEDADFDKEIVVSNARGRNKSVSDYTCRMSHVFGEFRRLLKPKGFVVVLFNSRKNREWHGIRNLLGECPDDNCRLEYVGRFECTYSVGSVVQDNRKGGLKSDFGLVFSKTDGIERHRQDTSKMLEPLPGWSSSWPPQLERVIE